MFSRVTRNVLNKSMYNTQKRTLGFWRRILGDEAVDARFPTTLEQATGLELEAAEDRSRGLKTFNHEPINGSFGTWLDPVIVPSFEDYRPVACTGGEEGSAFHHDIRWVNVRKGRRAVCDVCKQVFVHFPIPSSKEANERDAANGFGAPDSYQAVVYGLLPQKKIDIFEAMEMLENEAEYEKKLGKEWYFGEEFKHLYDFTSEDKIKGEIEEARGDL